MKGKGKRNHIGGTHDSTSSREKEGRPKTRGKVSVDRGRKREREVRTSFRVESRDEILRNLGTENKGELEDRCTTHKSVDSRTWDRIPTKGTAMTPIRLNDSKPREVRIPLQSIDKERLHSAVRKPLKENKRPKMKPRKNMVFRPECRAMVEKQKKDEEQHRVIKREASLLWDLLDNPVYDSPYDPESLFSADAIRIAKRGRRCTAETAVLGSNATRKAIRDFERTARRHGNDDAEVERLREYPDALAAYKRTLRKIRARR